MLKSLNILCLQPCQVAVNGWHYGQTVVWNCWPCHCFSLRKLFSIDGICKQSRSNVVFIQLPIFPRYMPDGRVNRRAWVIAVDWLYFVDSVHSVTWLDVSCSVNILRWKLCFCTVCPWWHEHSHVWADKALYSGGNSRPWRFCPAQTAAFHTNLLICAYNNTRMHCCRYDQSQLTYCICHYGWCYMVLETICTI